MANGLGSPEGTSGRGLVNATRLAFRELTRHSLRSFTCMAGVATGAGAYLLLLGAAHAFLGQFGALTRVLGVDIVVHRARATSPWGSSLVPAELEALQALPGVAGVSRVALGKTAVLGDNYFLVFGLDRTGPLVDHLALLAGTLPAADREEVAVGTLAAARLGLAPGGMLNLRGRRLAVTGVYRSGHALLDNGAIASVGLVQGLFNLQDGVNLALLTLQDPSRRGAAAAAIARRFGGLEASPAEAWVSMYGQMALVESFARLVALVALLVAMLGVSSLLHVALAERVGELAVLRAVGWSRWRIARVVLLETLMLAAGGAVAAIPLAELTLRVTVRLQAQAAGLLPLHVVGAVVPEAVGVTLAASLVGAVGPLVRAVRVAPARALRMP